MPRRPRGSRTDSIWHRPAPAPSRAGPGLSREEITRAAIDLADSGGLQAVSMRRIAERIGSAPTSIYWYVSDKDELVELMVDAVIGEIELPGRLTGDWRADLSSIAWATLTTMRLHPWFSQLGSPLVPGPSVLRYNAAIIPILTSCGLDDATTLNVLATLNNYIFGFVQRALAWDRHEARAATVHGQPDADDSEFGYDLSARLTMTGDESFAFGLDRFLDGIAALINNLQPLSPDSSCCSAGLRPWGVLAVVI